MGLPAHVDIQNLPISGATGTLNTTTANITVPVTATLVSIYGTVQFGCSLTVGADTDLDVAAYSDCVPMEANTTYLLRLNRRSGDFATRVNVEAAAGSGTYRIGFYK